MDSNLQEYNTPEQNTRTYSRQVTARDRVKEIFSYVKGKALTKTDTSMHYYQAEQNSSNGRAEMSLGNVSNV
jgi:hypothetical protein